MSGISLKIKLGGGGKASAGANVPTNGKSNATATTGGRDAGSTDADGSTRNGSSHSLTSSRSATHAAATVPSTGAPHGPVRIKLHLGSASRESLTGKTALEMDDATLLSSSSYYDEDEEGDSDRAASDNAASSGDDTDIDDSNENYTGQGHAYNDDSDGSQSASEHSQQHTKLTINLGARRPPSADQEEEHVASHGLPSNDHAPRASSTVPQKRPGGRRRAPLTLKRRTTSSAAARGTSMQQPVRKKKLSPFLEQTIASLIKKDEYGFFLEPVDTSLVTDYLDVIKQPMDFGTIQTRIGNRHYKSIDAFRSDVVLVCENAKKYNAPGTIYHKYAAKIQSYAESYLRKNENAVEPDDAEVGDLPQSKRRPSSTVSNEGESKRQRSEVHLTADGKRMTKKQMILEQQQRDGKRKYQKKNTSQFLYHADGSLAVEELEQRRLDQTLAAQFPFYFAQREQRFKYEEDKDRFFDYPLANHYLDYGPYEADDARSPMYTDRQRMRIQTIYGDVHGFAYATSLRAFTAGMAPDVQAYVDRVLAKVTHGNQAIVERVENAVERNLGASDGSVTEREVVTPSEVAATEKEVATSSKISTAKESADVNPIDKHVRTISSCYDKYGRAVERWPEQMAYLRTERINLDILVRDVEYPREAHAALTPTIVDNTMAATTPAEGGSAATSPLRTRDRRQSLVENETKLLATLPALPTTLQSADDLQAVLDVSGQLLGSVVESTTATLQEQNAGLEVFATKSSLPATTTAKPPPVDLLSANVQRMRHLRKNFIQLVKHVPVSELRPPMMQQQPPAHMRSSHTSAPHSQQHHSAPPPPPAPRTAP